MLEGKQLILATRQFAKEDRKKSWYYTISSILLMLICLFGTLFNFHISLKIICSIFAGLTFGRVFVIYHDYLHETILQRSPLAKTIFTLFGLYALTPTSIWKRSHDYHHTNNSKLFSASIGSYPVFTKKKFEQCSKSQQRLYLFIRHPLTIFFGYIFAFMYGMCIKALINNFKKHTDSLLALVLHFTGQSLLLYYFGWEGLILFSVLPHFISGALGAYLFYAQHNFPGVKFVGNEEWTYEGAALDSSSFMDLHPFWHWVTANIGYHHIHHLNARIPFYRLPEVMAHFPELQNPKVTSLKPKDIVACFKLKVWDTDKQEMVGV
jgi:omega-6 fatty acid desaturase (delta-12 desaturase)